MKKKLSLAFIALVFYFLSFAQTIRRPVAAGFPGAAAYSSSHTDAFSFISNQALLAKLKVMTAGLYSERKFMLTELSFYNAVIAWPTHSGNFGLKVGYYGFSAYTEAQAGLAYAKSLSDKIDVGIQFNYYSLKAAGYGKAATVSIEAGVIIHLTGQLHGGIQLNNPVGGKFWRNKDEKLPFVYTAGLGYDASDNFFICLEVEKEEDRPVNINAGIRYEFHPRIQARLGIATATANIGLGLAVAVGVLRIEMVAGYHPQLGVTPGLLLLFTGRSPGEDGQNLR